MAATASMLLTSALLMFTAVAIVGSTHGHALLDSARATAAAGFYFQFTQNFVLPFPMNLVLWPFTAAEWFIEWKITGEMS